MVTGFYRVHQSDYYFEQSGIMQTGWKSINNNWYFFNPSGALLKDSVTPDGYPVDKDGIWRVVVETTTESSTSETTETTESETTSVETTVIPDEKHEVQPETTSLLTTESSL